MSWKKISLVLLLLIILVYTCFPFYWAIVSALKKAGTGTFIVEYWPSEPVLKNFIYVHDCSDSIKTITKQQLVLIK